MARIEDALGIDAELSTDELLAIFQKATAEGIEAARVRLAEFVRPEEQPVVVYDWWDQIDKAARQMMAEGCTVEDLKKFVASK